MATSFQQTSSSLPMFVHGHTRDTANGSSLTKEFTSNSTTLQPGGGDGGFFYPFDNPWNLVSAATRETVIQVLDFVFILFVMVGVPGNIINCLVFYRQGLRDRMNLCLWWLAVSDLLYLLSFAATGTVASFIELVDPKLSETYDAYSRLYLLGQNLSSLTTSSCVTMVIAIERCLCVLFPLKAQTLMSTRTMAILLLTITLLLQLGFSLFPFKWTRKRIVNSQTGHSIWAFVPAGGPNQELISLIFYVVNDIILLFATNILVLFVVVICTVVTVVKLRQAMAWRLSANSSSSNTQNQQTALTKMLVVVCCIYVVCSTPGCTMALVRRVYPKFAPGGRYANLFNISHEFGYRVFSAINSSINFFVFCWMSSRFRQELRRLCVRKDTTAAKEQTELTKSTE